ncbi:proton-coupled amino acid transporter-like protein CG1139 [Cimex lectularius]|uniref:Amino acid transporter transmembrane domain-containing protein n=1 Tax=Cimex lectularius TaxID=79782 RepID=A0A8I6TCH0_CIMLE|nr:proton-coupled amino acid transporter-like protein CG1139 [Cimex lectularius]XP_014243864.1 proton-coupled amino acid transporter-like protein CG1139 [Cimex lectularius]
MDSTGDNMREHLAITIRDDKMSYDNPGMVYDGNTTEMKFRRLSNVNGPCVGKEAAESKSEKLPRDHKSIYIQNQNSFHPHKSAEKEYDPYDNRVVKHPTTYWETLIHMLKASLGTGILAMPEAFHNAGYAVATIGTIVIGFLCTYTIHILISTEYELCKRKKLPSMTYPATAQASVADGPKAIRGLAPAVPIICNIFLLLYQIGSCCIYVVFISTNIKDVCDYYFPEQQLDIKLYMLMILLPLILINWVRNLKYLAPLSSIANAVTLVSFVIIFYYMFDDVPAVSTRDAVAPFKGMPLFFGTVLFAMEAIGVVMPLENEMKEPRKFGNTFGVLNCAMVPITLLYTFVGFFGYLKYGPDVKGSITLSLPAHEKLAQAARLMLAFAIFITHALACYVAVDISWKEFCEPHVKKWKTFGEYIVRTLLVLLTIALAAAIPYLELFIALIGALCLSTMGLAFPALIQLFTYWYEYTGAQFVLFFLKNLTIVSISLLGFGVGTYTSIMAIVEEINK